MTGKKRKIIIGAAIAAGAILLGGIYVFYSVNFAGRINVELAEVARADSDWKNCASGNGIVGDYLWYRTTELMIKNSTDGVMIPTSYRIAGRLTSQPAESSERYDLEDQALLLRSYVRRGDVLAARTLKDRVNEVLVTPDCGRRDLAEWIGAYLEYYSSYGTKGDYEKISEICGYLFDEQGNMRPEDLTVATYVQGEFLSLADDENTGVMSTLERDSGQQDADQQDAGVTISGTRLASVDLRLIRDLENNGLLPQGTYDRYLEIVQGARISESIPLYAYAYYYSSEGEILYVTAHNVAAAVDMSESLRTLLHLCEVGQQDPEAYRYVKMTVVNGDAFCGTYYIANGYAGGAEDYGAYALIMRIALEADDMDLYDAAAGRIRDRIATRSTSPALYMVYRQDGERFDFYAAENLNVNLAVN